MTIDENSAGFLAVLGIIKSSPGVMVAQIACKAGLSLSHVKNILAVVSRTGAAFPVPIGLSRGWYEAELAKPLLEQWERTRRKRNKVGPRPQTKRDKIYAMSAAESGVSIAQIMAAIGVTVNVGGKHCLAMVQQRRIFRAERSGCRIRWFDTAERANAWASLPPMVPSEWAEPCRRSWETSREAQNAARAAKREADAAARANAQREAAERARMALRAKAKAKLVKAEKFQISRPPKGLPPPVILKQRGLGSEVDYSRAKLTVCPSVRHDDRYQVAPGVIVRGEFSAEWQRLRAAA